LVQRLAGERLGLIRRQCCRLWLDLHFV
jgi:hypothetical protein